MSREIAAARPVRSGLGASIASQGGLMEAELPGFERAVDDALRTFDRLSPCQAYPPFAELIHQGEPARAVYVIVQGLVKLECGQGDGECAIVALRSRGWPVGAAAVLIEQPHVVSAIAVTRCLIHQIPARDFRQLLRHRSELSWYLHLVQSGEVREQMLRGAELGAASALSRLKHFLLKLGSEAGRPEATGEVRVQMPLRYWEIAQLLGVGTTYFSEMLARLEREGALRRRKGWLMLMPDQLGRPGGWRSPSGAAKDRLPRV